MYDKLIKKRAPAVVRDPLLSLPIEVTEMILEYLSFRNIVYVFLSIHASTADQCSTCSRVSQNWRSLICSLPRLWIHLDLAGATRPVSVGTVTNYIKRSRKRITRATLQGWAAQSAILKCIATRCNALAHLEILGGFTSTLLVEVAPALQSLKVLRIAADTSLDAVSQLLSLCKSLEHAHFLSVTAKHSIKWTGDLSKLLTLSIDAKMKDPDKRSILLQLVSLLPEQLIFTLLTGLAIPDTNDWKHQAPLFPALVRVVLQYCSCSRLFDLNKATKPESGVFRCCGFPITSILDSDA